ncbi:Plasmodium exported protein, unknown function [Plasmodium knowlesi strain H]|uniref:Pv-fam-d protein n=3 Tax=Plasmodium knowlesi TaxID=5850 RepID=A0A5E7X8B3_PLAKH|nr:Plasmodium exported protein, unknown function [Plasmodium knowlesi strain H]OTN64130.1 Uncharacterized protein PKNOH_S140218300 [Plasmodium knowlesi]CAA9990611.1 Plasmodium exported protein, unknown function [Plasmodium knowlesi strain H]SBO26059.1 Plasmodium exported protein, unknown function [Plasmodium knowlesi strain H]SBO28748.1 Plasmodium exported protein, unknown function [Plasmodium knowlesi strain H]VVS80085.1 Plasmodium exported protein, unknown function [Plasmodium knowlesi strai
MREKTNYSSLTKFLAVSLLVWGCQYSNEASAVSTSRNEEHGKNNTSAAEAGRVLREDEEVIAEQRNAFLKEKLIGLKEDGQEDLNDNLALAKRFNALIQEENFQKGLNSLTTDENKKRQMNSYEYDENIQKLHNIFNSNANNRNPKKDINLMEFEDFGKVEYFQKLSNKPQKQTNPFTVTNNSTKQNGSSNLYSENTKEVNTHAPTSYFENLHNSMNVNRQPANKGTTTAPTSYFENLHNSMNVNRQPANKGTTTAPTSYFENLHNSMNVNRQPANKGTTTAPTSYFENLHNSMNVNRQPAKKTTIIHPADRFGEQQNSQNVNKLPTAFPNSLDTTDIFAKLHNSLNFDKPKEKTLNLYSDNDNSENSYSTLDDDFYSHNIFNGGYKTGNYESEDIGRQGFQYLYDEPWRHQNYKNYFNDLEENGTANTYFNKRYNDLVGENNFESERKGLRNVDGQQRNGLQKPLIDSSEHFPKGSYEKNTNDMTNNPYTANRISALAYAQNVEKLLNKLKYFNNVETAVEELKNDANFKKILDELQNGNGLERLFYVLKYSDDSEGILSELKKNDNIEKLIYVLNYYENNSKTPPKKELKNVASKKDKKGKFKLSLLKIKKKKLIGFITKIFSKFDKMYEDQLLSIFSSELDNDSTDNQKFFHLLKYTKILIPFVFAAIFVVILILVQNIAYYITVAAIIAATIGYTAFKVKKCHYKKELERMNMKNEKKPSKPTIIKTVPS